MTTATAEGYIQRYPCDCSNHTGICWIVRHPAMSPPISYSTEFGAKMALNHLRKRLRKT